MPSNIRWVRARAREGLWLVVWMFCKCVLCISANHIVQRRIQRFFSELLTCRVPGCRPCHCPSFKCISAFLRLFFLSSVLREGEKTEGRRMMARIRSSKSRTLPNLVCYYLFGIRLALIEHADLPFSFSLLIIIMMSNERRLHRLLLEY